PRGHRLCFHVPRPFAALLGPRVLVLVMMGPKSTPDCARLPLKAAAGRPGDRSEPGHSSEWFAALMRDRPTPPDCSRSPLTRRGASRIRNAPRESLLADAQPFDELAVPRGILRLQVVEEPPALADQLEQAAPRMVVFLVGLEMLGQVLDALGQERHLDLRRARVAIVGTEPLDHALLLCFVVQRPCAHHFSVFPPRLRRPGGRAS